MKKLFALILIVASGSHKAKKHKRQKSSKSKIVKNEESRPKSAAETSGVL